MILLINSPIFDTQQGVNEEDLLPPLGLGIILSSLRSSDISCQLIDAMLENITPDDLIKIINESNSKYVAINIFSTNYQLVQKIVEGVSRNVDFIIGGISTRTLYKHIFEWNTSNAIDIIYGDGELILPDIINCSVKEKPKEIASQRRFFKIDKDSKYFNIDISSIKPDRDFFDGEPIVNIHGLTEANIVTSRGCMYSCAYCSAAHSLNRSLSVRIQTVESIVSELNSIVEKYQSVESIRVLDDLFLRNQQTIDNAVDIFSKFCLKWRAMAHIKTFNGSHNSLLKKLVDSGLYELSIGIESGSDRILKLINKKNTVDNIKTTIPKLFSEGINVKGYFIYGFPSETEDDFKKTYELAQFLKKESVRNHVQFRTSVFMFRPYHGTILYNSIISSNSKNNDLDVLKSIIPDSELNKSIGRKQFNFKADNFSSVPDKILREYISKTNNLNNIDEL